MSVTITWETAMSEKWIPAKGEKVCVVNNTLVACFDGKESQPGDIVEVVSMLPSRDIVIVAISGCRHSQHMYLSDLKPLEFPKFQFELLNCICDSRTLFDCGCQCGFLKKERERV